jgi:hypothetical protein
MNVFAAIAPEEDPRLKSAVTAKYGDGSHYVIAPGQFLVFAPGLTSKQVSDSLGAADGGVGRLMVLRVTDYAGWHTRDMWEWINTRISATTPPAKPETSGG